MTNASTVPAYIRQQAQAMADETQEPHYIVCDIGSWLITPELPPTMPAGAVFPGRRPRGRWSEIGL